MNNNDASNQSSHDGLNTVSDIFSIPDELWHEIFMLLDATDLCHLSMVCKKFNQISNSDTIWKSLYQALELSDTVAEAHGEKTAELEDEDYKSHYKLYMTGIERSGWLPKDWRHQWRNPPSIKQFIAYHDGDNKGRTNVFNIAMIGNRGIGLTSLMLRGMENIYSSTYTSWFATKNNDSDYHQSRRYAGIENQGIMLTSLDYVGKRSRETYASIYKRSHGIVVAFDLTNRRSFKDVTRWMSEIDRSSVGSRPPNKIIVGCKVDLKESRKVTYEEAKKLAESLNVRYVETASKDGINVELAFAVLAHDIKHRLSHKEENWQQPTLKEEDKKCSIM